MAKMGKTKKQRTQKQMTEAETPKAADVLQEDPTVAAVMPGGTAGGNADPGPEPDREEIARLAYSYWEARGSANGSPEDDWFRAERELRAPK